MQACAQFLTQPLEHPADVLIKSRFYNLGGPLIFLFNGLRPLRNLIAERSNFARDLVKSPGWQVSAPGCSGPKSNVKSKTQNPTTRTGIGSRTRASKCCSGMRGWTSRWTSTDVPISSPRADLRSILGPARCFTACILFVFRTIFSRQDSNSSITSDS